MTDAGSVSVAHQAGILVAAGSAARRPKMRNSPANEENYFLHCIALHCIPYVGGSRDHKVKAIHPRNRRHVGKNDASTGLPRLA